MRKIDLALDLLRRNLSCLACPICAAPFCIENYSLICENGHTFDISKKGYVNFGFWEVIDAYDRELFYERKKVSAFGFFDPLYKAVAEVIEHYTNGGIILDAGCGEGSALAAIARLCEGSYSTFGVDLSKEAIRTAENDERRMFFVGDLTHMPFRQGAADVMLNILSPASYKEFARILVKGGLLIKVLPDVDYLRQFREMSENLPKEYTNDKTLSHFKTSFELLEERSCSYEFALQHEQLVSIAEMTPIFYNNESDKQRIIDSGLNSVSCDFKILIGKN